MLFDACDKMRFTGIIYNTSACTSNFNTTALISRYTMCPVQQNMSGDVRYAKVVCKSDTTACEQETGYWMKMECMDDDDASILRVHVNSQCWDKPQGYVVGTLNKCLNLLEGSYKMTYSSNTVTRSYWNSDDCMGPAQHENKFECGTCAAQSNMPAGYGFAKMECKGDLIANITANFTANITANITASVSLISGTIHGLATVGAWAVALAAGVSAA